MTGNGVAEEERRGRGGGGGVGALHLNAGFKSFERVDGDGVRG